MTDEFVSILYSSEQRKLALDQIVRLEEPKWGGGLYLRSRNRYRWLLIPRQLDGYSEIQSGLKRLGLIASKPLFPPNWEEFLLVLLFVATLILSISLRDLVLQLANLTLAIFVGLAMAYVISSNPDNFPRFRWTRFFGFLPVILAALYIWLQRPH